MITNWPKLRQTQDKGKASLCIDDDALFVNQQWSQTELCDSLCNTKAPNGNVAVICHEMLSIGVFFFFGLIPCVFFVALEVFFCRFCLLVDCNLGQLLSCA